MRAKCIGLGILAGMLAVCTLPGCSLNTAEGSVPATVPAFDFVPEGESSGKQEGDVPGEENRESGEAEGTKQSAGEISSKESETDVAGEFDTESLKDNGSETIQEPEEPDAEVSQPRLLDFVDVYGEAYQAEINPRVEEHSYLLEAFRQQDGLMTYTGDDNYTYRMGVDVSYHQGKINWEKVKAAGYDFAFLRIGYRGYQKGGLNLDTQFHNNIRGAREAGLDVGVYFFSQAVNEAEAAEEAEFVLEALEGYELQLPVVYDPESILDAEARTDHVSGEQFTDNTVLFCRMITDAGYEAMIYSNMLWEAYMFDLERLSEYRIWYADYEPLPQTPYHFSFWQYSNAGVVDGISSKVDLNIEMIPAGR